MKLAIAAVAIFLITTSLLSILTGRLNYKNYWGGVVFAPFALIVGIIFLIILFKGRKAPPRREDLFEPPLKDFNKW